MKFVRFKSSHSSVQYGILETNGSVDSRVQAIEGSPFGDFSTTDKFFDLEKVELLSPVLPSKILAVGLNYRAHAEEMKYGLPQEPMLFLKPPTAVIGPKAAIRYPSMSHRIDFEGELAVIIGKEIKAVSPAEAKEAIFGYTCLNDVTARDLQRSDKQWGRAKGFDTFAPMGPCMVTDLDPLSLRIESRLNGQMMQSAQTSQMLFDVYAIVSFASQVMTLLPGDVISTGTPDGVAPMKPGDVVEVEIEGIGILSNHVV